MLRRIFSKASGRSPLHDYIKKAFGFTPGNISLYEQALRHSSVSVKNESGIKDSNERLEFLGDAVIDAVVADYLYRNYPDKSEGDLTKMKSKIVSRKNLNTIGRELGVPEKLDLNLGGQEMHQSIVGNAFEAVVGAIYLDKGYTFTDQVLIKVLRRYGLQQRIHLDVDFKSKLHEWSQKEKKSLNFYVLKESQRDGKSEYTIEVLIDGRQMGVGIGKSKKAAEQQAAKEACRKIFPD